MATRIKQHKGAWWIFINHKGKRKAKRIGSSKRAAEIAAEKIQAKIALGQFEIKEEKSRSFRYLGVRRSVDGDLRESALKTGNLAEVCQRFPVASEADVRHETA